MLPDTITAWRPDAPTPDGCLVVPAAEVSRVSGFEIVTSTPFATGQPGCGYFDKDGLVWSTRFHPGGIGQASWDAEIAKGAQPVEGLGDEAIWIERA
ncbi:MAG: hypothetical protein ACYC65_04470 [Candidatus Limnocylindrales bacterium]